MVTAHFLLQGACPIHRVASDPCLTPSHAQNRVLYLRIGALQGRWNLTWLGRSCVLHNGLLLIFQLLVSTGSL